MHFLLIGLVLAVAIMFAMRWFASASPGAVRRVMRVLGGLMCLVVAGLLALRGLGVFALPIGGFGLALAFGGQVPFLGSQTKSTGQSSRVVTDTLEMELDHDSGRMHGRVLRGAHTGRMIDELSLEELADLWQACRSDDPQSADLVAAYMDVMHPSWRDDVSGGASDDHTSRSGQSGSAKMTVDEAYDVLGLDQSASREDVQRAHRTLMQKIHPDHGGSTYLAAKINAAKDVLLAVL